MYIKIIKVISNLRSIKKDPFLKNVKKASIYFSLNGVKTIERFELVFYFGA